MSEATTSMALPQGAPDEVITHSLLREVDLSAFGYNGKLALITLDNGLDYNRPNTLGLQSLTELNQAITDAEKLDVEAIAITGKPFIFAAGADLSGLAFLADRKSAHAIAKLGHDVFRRLGESKKKTFAFINGLALGGGLEIGLHCQYRTVATTAFVALPEVFLGIVPGWGGATLLPKLIGPQRAVQVIIANSLANNKMLKGAEALELEIVDRLYPPVDFLEKSLSFAADILSGREVITRKDYSRDQSDWDQALEEGRQAIEKKYRGAKIAAPEKALELIKAAQSATLSEGFDSEDNALADLVMSDTVRASLYAFNLIQKKRKKVEGAPKPALARKVSKVGIVGAGLMASQLALLIIRNLKVPVVITDLDQERVDKGVAYINAELDKLVSKKRLTGESARRLSSLIHGSVDKKSYSGCNFIIEAVFEELSVKQSLFKELEEIISPDCVLATNTSSLSVEKMSIGLKNPERVIGFHFFNPVAIMPLLEVARTTATDDATTATAIAIGKELKKTMIICKDAPAFVVNRLLTRFMGEVTDAIDEGTPPDVADSAMKPLGFPMTSLELLGLVGPGVALHVAKTLNENLGERYKISPTMENFVKNNVRTFYSKNSEGELVADPKVLQLIVAGDKPSTAEEVRIRALTALASEARAMLDEGVVSSPAEIDLCMLLGAGWPMHLGGILPYLDREGISESVTGSRFHAAGVASLPALA
jgi:3-hydroxyacyl-CoA dehydrogenase/enoyl-CoA hydratase/carnithine racemase